MMANRYKNKVRINLTIDPEVNERWGRLAKKYGWTKSGMVEDWLRTVLPIMEKEDPREIIRGYKGMVDEVGKEIEKAIGGKK